MDDKKLEKLGIYKDCYAINDYLTDCKCLKELYCKKEDCKFYKPNSEVSWKNIEDAINVYNLRHSKTCNQ